MMGSDQKPWRPPPARPARLGDYRLLAEIARGGFGAVYVGCADRPNGFRKIVAIKTVRPDLAAEPALVGMLIEEAQLASRLHHPHIAQLYDLGLGDDGGPFLVMEYVHGEALSAVLASAGAVPARVGVWIATCICAALAYAHALRDERGAELGVVHRDVSPQNILIDYDGVPRLLDFGIARTRHRAGDTDRGSIKGRLAYMAPEQRTGRPVDGRADLHALGVVLYQATAGAHPWDLAGGAVDRLPDPRPHRPGFPDALWAVIQRATAADPVDRFATADEMRAALREVATGLGPPVDRGELAALLDGPFAARRTAKQQLLDGRSVDGDTEVLAPVASPKVSPEVLEVAPSVGEQAPEPRPRHRASPARPGVSWRSWRTAALLAAVLLIPGLALSRSWLPWPATADALQRPCL